MIKKTITLLSGNPVFHQIVICTRKLHFWQLRRNICAKSVEFLIQNLGIDEKIKIVRTGNQNSALATENAVLSTVQKKDHQQSNYFPLWVQTDRNTPFFIKNVSSSKMIIRTSKMQFWQLYLNFSVKSPTHFLLKDPNCWKNSWTFHRKSNFPYNGRLCR